MHFIYIVYPAQPLLEHLLCYNIIDYFCFHFPNQKFNLLVDTEYILTNFSHD